MAERRFEKRTVNMGGQLLAVRPVKCIECGQPGDIIDRTRGGLPSVQVERMLKHKGWDIGASEKHDYCPKCVDDRRQARRQRKIKPINGHSLATPEDATVKATIPTSPITAIPSSPSETPPADMTRTDKRIIFAKLEEVYLDETSGYKTPWTDAAVAKDLNVPLAWVIAIREENFGPANDNAEIRSMLSRVTTAGAEAQVLLEEVKTIRKDGSALVGKINDIAGRATEIGKTLSGLLAIAERIERTLKS